MGFYFLFDFTIFKFRVEFNVGKEAKFTIINQKNKKRA
jgi:hypothetical protein